MPYFSPRTGAETDVSPAYASELSSTAHEVRKLLADAETSLAIPDTVTSLFTLLTDVMLNPEIPVSQILSMRAPKNVDAPKLFENMWTIAFSLGIVPGFENIVMHKGKVDEGTKRMSRSEVLITLKNTAIGTSNASGASDITFEINPSEEEESGCSVALAKTEKKQQFVFCTSKYFKKEKSADKYDIQNIIASADASRSRKDFDYRVVVLTNNREVAEEIFSRALRRYLVYLVKESNGILGRTDLEAAIVRLRERAYGYEDKAKFVENTFFADLPPRPFLSLRFHQELVVEKTLDLIKSGKTSALWGVVARGGKTYMAAGLIRALLPEITSAFIILGAYTETSTQFIDDLLRTSARGFQDFKDIEVIDVKNEKFTYSNKKKYVFVLSFELLKAVDKGNAKERHVMELLKRGVLKPELLFFDETHKGGTTEIAQDAMELLGEDNFRVYMTATYIKPLLRPEFKIDSENLITWGYEDIQKAKSISLPDTQTYFQVKYGKELCNRVLDAQSVRGNDVQKQYEKFPDLQFLNTDFSPKFLEKMTEQNIYEPKRGFSMRALLATDSKCKSVPYKNRWECLTNPVAVATFVNFMGPAHTQLEKIGTRTVTKLASASEHIMTRIGRASQISGDVLKNVDTEFIPHSQLWFLPPGVGSGGNLNTVITAVGSMLHQHPWFRKHFSVICVASGFDPRKDAEFKYDGDDTGFAVFLNATDIKNKILTLEKQARKDGRGIIILAGMMLTLGVSLPCVNVVGLLDDSESADVTYQKMFRALTENPGKKTGYVVDMNPLRTNRTLYTYSVAEKEQSAPVEYREHVDATTLTQLYLINEDQLFVTSTENRLLPKDIHAKITEYIENVSASFKSIMDELNSNAQSINLDEEFDQVKSALLESKPESREVRVGEERDVPDVPTGVENVKAPVPAAEPVVDEKKVSEANLRRSLNESIVTATVLLGVLSPAKTYDDAVQYYKENQNDIQDVVYDKVMEQGLFDTEQSKAISLRDILKTGLTKAREKQAVTYLKMVKRMENAGGDQREVLNILTQELKPKKTAKDARGEVFTPPELVEEMLDHLPAEVWENPDLKWLDPANGIGNFPIIAFAKLNEGLKDKIPDDAKRRKHIIESMIYMSELAPSNNAIARNLFGKMCGDPECKLNILTADFLTSDFEKGFDVSKFDIIMGNPPYNPPKTETGSSGNSIWQNFVMKSESILAPNGFICFVHPPGWKKPTEDVYVPTKFKDGNFKGQIRQGQVWQYLKTRGSFNYIYTNDQKSKALEYFPNFPLVDYYVFQKDGKSKCSTRNVFDGKEYTSSDIMIDPRLTYLPNLLTKETLKVLSSVTTAEPSLTFSRGIDERIAVSWDGPEINWFYDANTKGFQYKKHGATARTKSGTAKDTVNIDKLVVNFGGGFDAYNVQFISKDDQMGVLDKTMYVQAKSVEHGKQLEKLFNSDIVKFIFLITQYSFGAIKQNELLVANSIVVPPVDVEDYYEFFGITDMKPFIEKILEDRAALKAPKKKTSGGTLRRKPSPNATRRNSPK